MDKKQIIIELFENWANEHYSGLEQLPLSGSYREYYRIKSKTKQAIAVYNHDKKENIAFIEFSKTFIKAGLNVPEIYCVNNDKQVYLIEDLGNTNLFDIIVAERKDKGFTNKLLELYKSTITELPKFQIIASNNIDYNLCYPRDRFDKQSMMWDLSYFKYYFLKLAKIHFDEQLLEDDFHKFTNYLLKAETGFFMYRDFQSRNIMIKNNLPYFIDYQGGRKGALQYDIASLLFDAKADIPIEIRQDLFKYYIKVVQNHIDIDITKFTEHYYGYVLIRIMQAMGAYGFRGFYEKKSHFLQSIPFALKNLKWVLKNIQLPVKIPTLLNILDDVTNSHFLQNISKQAVTQKSDLTVEVNSFSYKKGIPQDNSGNGGGFVFDCRAIHNPGKFDEYKYLCGKDKAVIDFFNNETEAHTFLQSVYNIVDASVEKYISRKFSNLMVNFGCTGGQHRSVYCAENLAKHLKNKYKINIRLRHIESDNWLKKT